MKKEILVFLKSWLIILESLMHPCTTTIIHRDYETGRVWAPREERESNT